MDELIVLLYIVLGYWSVGVTVYSGVTRVGTMYSLFMSRFILGLLLGWILIPIAILKVIVLR